MAIQETLDYLTGVEGWLIDDIETEDTEVVVNDHQTVLISRKHEVFLSGKSGYMVLMFKAMSTKLQLAIQYQKFINPNPMVTIVRPNTNYSLKQFVKENSKE